MYDRSTLVPDEERPWLRINPELIPSNVDPDMVMDFRNFLYVAMKYLGMGEPTRLQYAMAYRLQYGPESFQLQAGRGAGKSVLTSIFTTWLLLRDPNTVVMVLSATGNKSTEFISMTRNTIALVPQLAHLIPGPNTKDSAFGFNVESRTRIGQDASVFARGISGQITGSHADWVIMDDVEIEGNANTAEAREKLLQKVWEIEQIRNVGGGIRILGTPQSSESIYKKMREAYACHKFPAVMPDPDIFGQIQDCDEFIYELQAEGLGIGKATQPERFDDELLQSRLLKVGPTLYSLHYNLDTSLADADKFPLRLADLVVLDLDKDVHPEKIVWSSKPTKEYTSYGLQGDFITEPMYISNEYKNYQQTIMTIDPSGRGRDETAVVVASAGNGYIFIHECIGYEGGYELPFLKKIAKVVNEYPNLNLIRYEENFGDGMFGNLLRPVIGEMCPRPVGIEGYTVFGQKEERILAAMEPVMGAHRLVMSPRSIKQEETQRQMTRLYRERGALSHDDRIDALAATVQYFEESLGVDVDKAVEAAKQRRLDESWQMMKNDSQRGIWLLGEAASGAVRLAHDKYKNVSQPAESPLTKLQRRFGR